LQVHAKLPGVSVQNAPAAQLWLPVVHSFRFVQLTPLPVHPALQAHVKLPSVSVQAANPSQLFAPSAHSFTLVQLTPVPM
jgi:hypothetical protein